MDRGVGMRNAHLKGGYTVTFDEDSGIYILHNRFSGYLGHFFSKEEALSEHDFLINGEAE